MLTIALVATAFGVFLLTGQSRPTNEAAKAENIEAVRVIGGPGVGPDPSFDRPLSAAFGPGGAIYVSDTGNDRVCVFDSDGRFLYEFGRSALATRTLGGAPTEPILRSPAGIALADNRVYVGNVRKSGVDVFSTTGRHVRTLRATPASGTNSPLASDAMAYTDVWVGEDRIYLTDAASLTVLDSTGTVVWRVAETTGSIGAFARPNGVAVSPSGVTYVSDSNNGRLVALDVQGRVIWDTAGYSMGGQSTKKRDVGVPRGIAIEPDGSILVADAVGQRLVELTSAGRIRGSYGSEGAEPGRFSYPNDVDVRGDLVLVADKANDRVQIVRLKRR